jgi:hypothetical protein
MQMKCRCLVRLRTDGPFYIHTAGSTTFQRFVLLSAVSKTYFCAGPRPKVLAKSGTFAAILAFEVKQSVTNEKPVRHVDFVDIGMIPIVALMETVAAIQVGPLSRMALLGNSYSSKQRPYRINF